MNAQFTVRYQGKHSGTVYQDRVAMKELRSFLKRIMSLYRLVQISRDEDGTSPLEWSLTVALMVLAVWLVPYATKGVTILAMVQQTFGQIFLRLAAALSGQSF